ncbi:2-dehydropantoate 2-reductase-like protein [Lentithecium fluviatile CBS 122367]|uniref:2-dehydropantoate 2-reductase-like protein n=1 Tax=Lentithecium fluviatile CBS 122367 TaxID=1168545 RepID=A0A6G1IEF3_9PLEO|nr:2-dehydropantoate 2-reductase-like protein [Lentithecium fluviatile CBS 122367]
MQTPWLIRPLHLPFLLQPTTKNVLVIGGGSVGAIAALNLDVGGLANVTITLRSNYIPVFFQGYNIESCDHGKLEGWKPGEVLSAVPDLEKQGQKPYDYIVLATKNIPDVPPTAVDLVATALPKDNAHTVLVLIQNGLNIEKPFLEAYPNTMVLSGVSLIGSKEVRPGHIVQDEHDRLLIGAFANPNISKQDILEERAKEFVELYSRGGKTDCKYSPDVLHDRWRKLVYNACLNPICAITGLDTGRIRLAEGAVEGLVRPAMREIVAAAEALGVKLADDVVEYMIGVDPLDLYLAPSMLADVGKGNYIEFENLLGEPLREGKKAGVAMPTLEVLYQIAKALQWRTKAERGVVKVPPKRGEEE